MVERAPRVARVRGNEGPGAGEDRALRAHPDHRPPPFLPDPRRCRRRVCAGDGGHVAASRGGSRPSHRPPKSSEDGGRRLASITALVDAALSAGHLALGGPAPLGRVAAERRFAGSRRGVMIAHSAIVAFVGDLPIEFAAHALSAQELRMALCCASNSVSISTPVLELARLLQRNEPLGATGALVGAWRLCWAARALWALSLGLVVFGILRAERAGSSNPSRPPSCPHADMKEDADQAVCWGTRTRLATRAEHGSAR